MLDNLDELIEINLKLLYESPNKYMWRIDFKNEKGQKIQDSIRFAKILDKKGLMDLESVQLHKCELTEFGNKIIISGGWIKYLEEDKQKENNKVSKISIENYIGGNNNGIQSSRSDFIKPAIKNANKITEIKPPRKSFLEIAFLAIGGIAAIIVVYEFIIKFKIFTY